MNWNLVAVLALGVTGLTATGCAMPTQADTAEKTESTSEAVSAPLGYATIPGVGTVAVNSASASGSSPGVAVLVMPSGPFLGALENEVGHALSSSVTIYVVKEVAGGTAVSEKILLEQPVIETVTTSSTGAIVEAKIAFAKIVYVT